LSAGDAGCAYVPLAHEYLGAPAQPGLDDLAAALGSLLADGAVVKVVEDLQLHQHLLARAGVPVSGWDLDVAVAAFMLNPGRSSYPLEQLAREYLGREIGTLESLTGAGAKRVAGPRLEIEKVAAAAAERADAIHRLRDPLRERLADAALLELYETVDGPLLPLLAQMEHHGIRVKVTTLEQMSKQMEGELDRLRGEIHSAAGVEFNVDSPKQLREVLFDKLGLKTRRKTAKSKVSSTDARVLEELAGEAPIARTILEYRELAKLKGTYVDRLPTLVNPRTGRIHTRFHPTGAATGRLSSSDPNLQNIPVRTAAGREIRSAFVADEGHVFLAADYSQVELRILAHLTQAPGLIEAFRQGEDIHRHTAAQVFGVLPDLVSDTMRRQAKAVNFGLLYGMSERRLAAEQGMKLKDARQFVQAYFERFSGVRDYIDRIRAEAERDGAVRTLLGRVRYFPQLHQRVNRGIHEQALRAAVNTTVQGTAADLMKMAMLGVAAALREAGLAARILLQVHDELLLEVPEGELEPTREATCSAMERVFPLDVPLVVDARVGTNWKDVV
jgi:DNA polymerase-1